MAALRERGVIADVVPERSVAESLVEALEKVDVDGKPVLIARAAEAREILPDALRERGAKLDVVSLYETVPEKPDPEALERAREADYITFTSASTVRNLVAALGDDLPRSAGVVSIGPVTSEAAREAGLEVHVEAADHDLDGLVVALLAAASDRYAAGVMAEGLPITFLSDYGHEDEFAGVCRAVIRQIAPDAPLIDLTHGIGRQGIRHGALALANALPFCPPGVHLAVVDPGVGTARRPVVVTTADEGRFLVGPDNGLLCARRSSASAASPVRSTSPRSPFRLEPVSATFHGRDLFAPVAAHIALGARLDEAGSKFEPARADAARAALPEPTDGGVRRPRPVRRPLRQRQPRPRRRGGRASRAAAGAADGAARARRALRGDLDRNLRRRRTGRAAALSQTPRAGWPWRSTAAAPPGCSTWSPTPRSSCAR